MATVQWGGEEFELISVYTRAQALADGILRDVSETAREAGIRHPVAVTVAVWGDVVEPDERARAKGESREGRLWDLIWMLSVAIRGASPRTTVIPFRVIATSGGQRRLVSLKAECHPGDEGEPVITVMLPHED